MKPRTVILIMLCLPLAFFGIGMNGYAETQVKVLDVLFVNPTLAKGTEVRLTASWCLWGRDTCMDEDAANDVAYFLGGIFDNNNFGNYIVQANKWSRIKVYYDDSVDPFFRLVHIDELGFRWGDTHVYNWTYDSHFGKSSKAWRAESSRAISMNDSPDGEIIIFGYEPRDRYELDLWVDCDHNHSMCPPDDSSPGGENYLGVTLIDRDILSHDKIEVESIELFSTVDYLFNFSGKHTPLAHLLRIGVMLLDIPPDTMPGFVINMGSNQMKNMQYYDFIKPPCDEVENEGGECRGEPEEGTELKVFGGLKFNNINFKDEFSKCVIMVEQQGLLDIPSRVVNCSDLPPELPLGMYSMPVTLGQDACFVKGFDLEYTDGKWNISVMEYLGTSKANK